MRFKNFNSNFGKPSKGLVHKLFFSFITFVYRIKKSLSLMSKLERRLAVFFSLLFLVLMGAKSWEIYNSNTKLIPNYGGSYKEIIVGDLKFVNPIVASSDVDKSTSKLIYSGLVKVEAGGDISPDIAESWSVSADNLNYTFKIKDGITFHDGQPLTSSDVSYTIELIKNPDLKSPLLERWRDVTVSSPDEKTVVFTLPKTYGPFIQSCDFGVLPSYLSFDQSSSQFIGSGPYKFIKMEQSLGTIGSKITQVKLENNVSYYKGTPFIKELVLMFFDNKDDAKRAFKEERADAISGIDVAAIEDLNNIKNLSFTTGKTLALILNLRVDKLKDKNFRQQVLQGKAFETQQSLTLITLEGELQHQKAEEIKRDLEKNNVVLNIRYLTPVEMQNSLDKKDYELLLYGFDFSYDRDPYAFWHSSQVAKNNFSGLSDKDTDIKIEDARMLPDITERNKRYDSLYQSITDLSVAKFYSPIEYHYGVSANVKGVEAKAINNVAMKYLGIEKWYIKEKRVKK